ncbi:MAG: class I SAM-dependent methyltransferase [Thaumarchaeota archaeon]|nr:class I SAM-dependent methyltransferase [Nitrososphaerota archaeon]
MERKQPIIGNFNWVTPSTPLSSINLNWRERELPERLRTKHVHRLHPYLGKYVPQLVEIFLRKFEPQTVLDPFCGSGTTLVEANSLGIASVGCDVSSFNCLLSKVKTDKYDVRKLESEIKDILSRTVAEINRAGIRKELVEKEATPFLKQWFSSKALFQMLLYRSFIENYEYSDVLKIILSRSARSARLTTHFDLDFPKKPQTEPYFCHKHQRTCRPTDDALTFLSRYSLDTIKRITEFSKLRTDAPVKVICGDSRKVELPQFDTVVTSPPYVGLIDYHEQHRYAYELLGLPDRKDLEIGAASNGNSKKSRADYVKGIGEVFANVRNSIKDNGVVVIVVHDKDKLFADMASNIGFKTEEVLVRNVNRRTGRRGADFFEQILIWRAA